MSNIVNEGEEKNIVYKGNNYLLSDFNLTMSVVDGNLVLKDRYTQEAVEMCEASETSGKKPTIAKQIPLSEVIGTNRLISVKNGVSTIGFKLEKLNKDSEAIISEFIWIIGPDSIVAKGVQTGGSHLNIRYIKDGKTRICSISDHGKVTAIAPNRKMHTFENGLANDESSQSIRRMPHFLAIVSYFESLYPSIKNIGTILLTDGEIRKYADIENRYARSCYAVTYDEMTERRELASRLDKIEDTYRDLSALDNRTERQEADLNKCAENIRMIYKELFRECDKDYCKVLQAITQ